MIHYLFKRVLLLNGVVCIKTLKLCLISAIFSLFRSKFQSSKEVL